MKPGGRPPLLTVDISLPDVEELQKLVQEGLEKGVLNYDEIAAGLDDVELTKEQIEDFYTYLIDHGVELMEGETHKHPPHEQLPMAEEEKGPKLDLSVEPSLDSLRLYLREIGKVSLLTADQEVYLAKRIERGDMSAKTQMIEANLRLVVSSARSCGCRSSRSRWRSRSARRRSRSSVTSSRTSRRNRPSTPPRCRYAVRMSSMLCPHCPNASAR